MSSGKPRSPEEVVRLARARASLPADLPEGVEVDFMFLDEDDQLRQMHENDSMAFLPARGFGQTAEEDLGGKGAIPYVDVDFAPLSAALTAGRVTCQHYGIGNEFPAGNPVPPFALFRLVVDGRWNTPINVNLDKAPDGFIDEAIDRGLYVRFQPTEPGGEFPYIKIEAMRRFESPTVVDPKTGRNSPCPCGSGRKFKRCHGR